MYPVFKGTDENIKIQSFDELPNRVKVYIATAFTTGRSIPSGGDTNQLLVKTSNDDFDVDWKFLPNFSIGDNVYNGSEEITVPLILNSEIDKLF